MKRYNHREAKGYNYSNRNAALSHLSNVVAGFALPNEPFNLCHKSKSRSRQRKRSKFRDSKDFQRRKEKTIVAYGNASIMGTMRKHTPVPVKVIPIFNYHSVLFLIYFAEIIKSNS